MDYPLLTEKGVEALQTFNQSVQDAGGTVMPWARLKDTTIQELLNICGQNHIGFVYEEPAENNSKPLPQKKT